jgi:hypothetical protein
LEGEFTPRTTNSGERFALRSSPQLERAFAKAIAGPQAASELKPVLKLIVALDRQLASPGAARQLRVLIRAVPGSAQVLRAIAGPGSTTAKARFARLEGRGRVASTPPVPPPEGAIPLHKLIDPVRRAPPRRAPSRRS